MCVPFQIFDLCMLHKYLCLDFQKKAVQKYTLLTSSTLEVCLQGTIYYLSIKGMMDRLDIIIVEQNSCCRKCISSRTYCYKANTNSDISAVPRAWKTKHIHKVPSEIFNPDKIFLRWDLSDQTLTRWRSAVEHGSRPVGGTLDLENSGNLCSAALQSGSQTLWRTCAAGSYLTSSH